LRTSAQSGAVLPPARALVSLGMLGGSFDRLEF
jgi:hypothetical protein